MEPVIICEFDKIITTQSKKAVKSLRDICFRPVPNVKFIAGITEKLTELHESGSKIVLVAHENEMFVKESLWHLNACRLFDQILILSEYSS